MVRLGFQPVKHKSENLVVTLAQRSPLICGVNFHVYGRFSTPFYPIFLGVGLPAFSATTVRFRGSTFL